MQEPEEIETRYRKGEALVDQAEKKARQELDKLVAGWPERAGLAGWNSKRRSRRGGSHCLGRVENSRGLARWRPAGMLASMQTPPEYFEEIEAWMTRHDWAVEGLDRGEKDPALTRASLAIFEDLYAKWRPRLTDPVEIEKLR